MQHVNKLQFIASGTPRIEFDLSVRAWYVRFKTTKVTKTISEDKGGVIAAIDLDANNHVVGVELLGVREFSLQVLKKVSAVDTSEIDFAKARFVHASNHNLAVS